MLSWRQLILFLVLSVWWLSGCTTRSHICPEAGCLTDAVEVAPIGRLLERGQIVPDVSEVVPSESDITPPERTQLHRVLTEAECQCTAADHASVANLIDLENGIASCCNKNCRASKQQATALQSELMAYRSASERNKAAAEALELFFLLAEVEFGRDALAQSLAEIDKIRDYMVQIRASGLDLDIAESAVYNRRGELLDQKAKLALDWSRLNSELRRRLGLDVDDQTPIWPEADLKVQVAQIHVDTAIAEGLAMRPDVAAIQRLVACLDTNSLTQARSSLQAVDAMLGSAAGKSCLFQVLAKSAENCEAANRVEQLNQLLVHLQRAVAEEIRQAVHTVEARIQQVAIAKQRLANRRKSLDDLKLQWGGPDVTAFQVSDAQLKVIQAQTDLVHQVVAWEIAHVKLKQAQGLFALECGYTEPGGANGYVPTDQDAPAPKIDVEPTDDVAPSPPPPFSVEEPALLRQPASVTDGDSAAGENAPDDSMVADDLPLKQLRQPEAVLDSAGGAGPSPPGGTVTDGPDAQTLAPPAEDGMPSRIEKEQESAAPTAPDNSDPTANEATGQPDATTSLPSANRKLPRDMVFGEELSAAETVDFPAVVARDVSRQIPGTPHRFASDLRQPESLTTAQPERRNTEPAKRGDVEKHRVAPRDAAPVQAAKTPQFTTPGLRQPESIVNATAQPRAANVSARESGGTGLIASPAEDSDGSQVGPQLELAAIRQPESVATLGGEAQIAGSVARRSGPIGARVSPVSISKEKLTKPPASLPTLRQPESVVSVGTQPRVAGPVHRVCDRCDSARRPVESTVEKDRASPSDRTVLRQPMSFASVQIPPDGPGEVVRRVCDQCTSTAVEGGSSLVEPVALRPKHATERQPISFASAAVEPQISTAAVHRPCNECESANGTDRCSCPYERARCEQVLYRPPRFVSNAQRHLQPPRISGGCRSGSCQ